MRSLFRLILSLWVVSPGAALFCSSGREFPVNNCTACLLFDQTTARGNVAMAICEERGADRAGGMAYACVCEDFPSHSMVPDLRFYPHKEGNMTRCASSWETVPGVVSACWYLSAGVLLYVSAHLFYIVSISGICCAGRHACTKINGAALSFTVSILFWFSMPVLGLVSQSRLPINQGFSAATVVATCFLSIGQALFYPSIADVAYPEEDKANQRCRINAFFWCLAGGTMVSSVLAAIVPVVYEDAAHVGGYAQQVGFLLITIQLIYCNIFTAIAHKNMLKVSLQHHQHE